MSVCAVGPLIWPPENKANALCGLLCFFIYGTPSLHAINAHRHKDRHSALGCSRFWQSKTFAVVYVWFNLKMSAASAGTLRLRVEVDEGLAPAASGRPQRCWWKPSTVSEGSTIRDVAAEVSRRRHISVLAGLRPAAANARRAAQAKRRTSP